MPVMESQRKYVDPGNIHEPARLGRMQTQSWLGGALIRQHRIIEDVTEGGSDSLERLSGSVDGQWLRTTNRENPQIVYAIDVVGMLVCIDDRINSGDALREQLQPELRWSIDEDFGTSDVENGAGAAAPISRICRAADGTVTPDLRHAEGRTRSEEREAHCLNCFNLQEVGSAGHVKRNPCRHHQALAWLGKLALKYLLPSHSEHGVVIS